MKHYGILDNINSPADLRGLSYTALAKVCAELRKFIVDTVSQTGGHLASNLGIVELAVALEREFDSAHDRIIYDVGHQSYVHKILTGRKRAFGSLRKYGGLSGFMQPEESNADPCVTGHASNSVSVALGMARARTLQNDHYHVVAVIGDGALTGGMAYEALNDAGASHEPLLVVLNDNNMSIARNVGALSRHLSRLRVNPKYLQAKSQVKETLEQAPGGQAAADLISRSKARVRRAFISSTIFELMGFVYLGPVDGHDLKSICELLVIAKKEKRPVLLHVITKKGRGYALSERFPERFHGVSPFDAATGKNLTEATEDFSACFGKTLCALAEQDSRICAVTAAMPSGTGLSAFAKRFPNRFFDVGIAEEHALAMAAGMAARGMLPVVAIYSTFLQRAYDQLIHDVAIGGLHMVICIDRAGIVGADGPTHNGVFDVGFLRKIPGFKLYAPANFAELRAMLPHALYHETGPVAVRYPRGGETIFQANTANNPAVWLREGGDTLIATYGTLVDEALAAADLLAEKGLVTAVYKWNELSAPLDAVFLERLAACRAAAVVEDVVQTGGMGEATAAALALNRLRPPRLALLNTGNRFLPQGSVKELRRLCGIDAESIAATLTEGVHGKNSTGHSDL